MLFQSHSVRRPLLMKRLLLHAASCCWVLHLAHPTPWSHHQVVLVLVVLEKCPPSLQRQRHAFKGAERSLEGAGGHARRFTSGQS